MKKAMIVTVGTGTRPDVDIVKPLKKTIDDSRPDYLVLVATVESIPFAQRVAQGLNISSDQYMILSLTDGENVQEIFREVNTCLRRLFLMGYEPGQVVGDFTSGTKAMSSGAVLSLVYNSCGTLKYITGVRKNGVVVNGSEKFLIIPPSSVYALRDLQGMRRLMINLRFDSAIQVSEGINPHLLAPPEQQLRGVLTGLAKAYRFWDLFDHRRFRGEYDQVWSEEEKIMDTWVTRELEVFKLEEGISQRITAIGIALDQRKLTEDALADVFNNSERRLKEGKYDDAVARLYRLTEMFAQWVLMEHHGISTDDVPLEKIPASSQQKYEKDRDNKSGKILVGLHKAYELLADLGNNLGQRFIGDDTIQGLLKDRNNSILAHGTKPVSREACEAMKEKVVNLIREAIPDFLQRCQTLQFPWLIEKKETHEFVERRRR